MIVKVTCIILLIISTFKGVQSYCNCAVNYKAVGCWKDRRFNRALPVLLFNDRENIPWYQWSQYLPDLVCRCANLAKQNGYKYFGVQFYGECWAGYSPQADTEYKKHGEGNGCIDGDFKVCKSGDCIGIGNHNYIYEVESLYHCSVKFERLGCYYDSTKNRAIPELVLNDRDYIDWNNYGKYLRELTCKCAEKVLEKGYNTFGLQHYGECWSGPEVATDYYKHGTSGLCLNTCYEKCKNFNSFCIGSHSLMFVYRISVDECELPRTTDGCYNENQSDRALRELIINDVDSTSPKFMGIFLTDYDNWEQYIEGLICRCARKTKEKGYTHFGIYNRGECWGGMDSFSTYSKHGTSNECYYNNITPCTSADQCTGGENTVFVYHI